MVFMDRTLHWFRNDLRLSDNPALHAAVSNGAVLPVYVLDDENSGPYQFGGASRVWLHHSLASLNDDLNGNLVVVSGDAATLIPELVAAHSITKVSWNRMYEPWAIKRDTKIKENLKGQGVDVQSFNGALLWEPWDVKKQDGTPYRVFTPFYRKGCLNLSQPRTPLPKPKKIDFIDTPSRGSIDDLNLLPEVNWHQSVAKHWKIGEQHAHKRLKSFLSSGIKHYKDGRNIPSKPYVSALSPYLRFGEISPNQVWYAARDLAHDRNVDHFCSELGWREFSYNLLYHNPELPTKNLQSKFDKFPWDQNEDALKAWQKGLTGIPFVDAGMRELWQTGTMHNRVRMVVGSFLVKNLLLDWRHGERWFWDTLFDADLANNSASWQWVAGCGADAAPYFRIFNPVGQGQKFDPEGDYVRQYIPELAALPNKYLFNPWEAPEEILADAKVVLGQTYPEPIINISQTRTSALEAFASLKTN